MNIFFLLCASIDKNLVNDNNLGDSDDEIFFLLQQQFSSPRQLFCAYEDSAYSYGDGDHYVFSGSKYFTDDKHLHYNDNEYLNYDSSKYFNKCDDACFNKA